jgi:hypothetical protein
LVECAGLSLHLDQTPPIPADTIWTSYSALLSESADWRVGSLVGPAATQFQVQTVLGALTRLRIRGEFITGSGNGDLDNVILNGVPEPSCLALLNGSAVLFGSSAVKPCGDEPSRLWRKSK